MRRSILWVIPLVLVTVGAMLVMQYRFLRRLESATVRAERDRLRTSVDALTRSVEDRFRKEAMATLDLSPGQLLDSDAASRHFRAERFSPVEHWFTIDFTTREPVHYFDLEGERVWVEESKAVAVKIAVLSWMVQARDGAPVTARLLAGDMHDPKNRVVAYPVLDANRQVVGAAGMVLDESRTRAWLRTVAQEELKRTNHGRFRLVRVGDAAVFQSRMSGDGAFLTQPLGFIFGDWRLGVRDSCASPEVLAAHNFRVNMLWTGGAALMLLLSIGLAIHFAWRQARLSQMKSDFVSNVSHELRTPLASIRVFGEYMRMGRVTKEEKVREYGEYIENESRRLTALINNILDFSKIESAEKNYQLVETDLAEVVTQTVAAFETPLREAGVRVQVALPAAPLPPMLLDRGAIAQAMVNLLDNAVKYSGNSPWIRVSITAEPRVVRVSVQDRGIGVPAAEQKKVFDKFYRVGSSLVHDVKGSGLGLSIVKHIAQAHGGDVELSSAAGEGSTFTLVLPRRRAPEAVVTTSAEAQVTRTASEGHA